MPVDQSLIEAAIELLKRRFPQSGGVAAALYLEDGQILTGTRAWHELPYKSDSGKPDKGARLRAVQQGCYRGF